jgi:hypothetical protein
MSTYEITYLPHTEIPPERIEAFSHEVDDSTTPPTHLFFVIRQSVSSAPPEKRIEVESVREIV